MSASNSPAAVRRDQGASISIHHAMSRGLEGHRRGGAIFQDELHLSNIRAVMSECWEHEYSHKKWVRATLWDQLFLYLDNPRLTHSHQILICSSFTIPLTWTELKPELKYRFFYWLTHVLPSLLEHWALNEVNRLIFWEKIGSLFKCSNSSYNFSDFE